MALAPLPPACASLGAFGHALNGLPCAKADPSQRRDPEPGQYQEHGAHHEVMQHVAKRVVQTDQRIESPRE